MGKRIAQQFTERLLKACHNVPGLDKLGNAPDADYDWVKAAQIFIAFRAELKKAKILILPNEISCETVQVEAVTGMKLNQVTLKKEFVIQDCCSAEKLTLTAFGQAMDEADKALNKAKTAVFKYLLRDLGLIPWLDVDDSEHDQSVNDYTAPVESKKRGSQSAHQLAIRNVVAFTRACQVGGKTLIQQAAYLHALGKKDIAELTPEQHKVAMKWAFKNGDLAEVMEMSRNIAEKKKANGAAPEPEPTSGMVGD